MVTDNCVAAAAATAAPAAGVGLGAADQGVLLMQRLLHEILSHPDAVKKLPVGKLQVDVSSREQHTAGSTNHAAPETPTCQPASSGTGWYSLAKHAEEHELLYNSPKE